MKLHNLLLASAVVLGAALAVPANAATWLFSYTGVDPGNNNAQVTASGVLTTDGNQPSITYSQANALYGGSDPTAGLYGYDVVSITGTRTEGLVAQSISGLIGTAGTSQFVWPNSVPASPPPGWNFDNVVYSAQALKAVDVLGIEYAAVAGDATSLYNVYFQNGQFFENYVPLSSVSISPIPLPAALPLFAAALVGLGAFGWYKRAS